MNQTSATSPIQSFRRVIRRALARRGDPHLYTTHLLYESILAMPDDAETVEWKREVVCRALKGSDALLTLPFSNLLYSLGELLLMPSLWERYLGELREWMAKPVCSPEGAWLHPAPHVGGWAILLDGFQEEASRLAKGAGLLRSMNREAELAQAWEAACHRQFEIHRAILRNPVNGLWHNGRGWVPGEPDRLSPGAWSRGHGWLLRGMVESLEALQREGNAFPPLRDMLEALSDTLLQRQDPNGMWHVLLHRPAEESFAESSGSALIAAAWLKAVRLGFLNETFRGAAVHAAHALAEGFVDAEGGVLSVSPGPGPLESEAPYLKTPLKDGDAHGDLAVGFLLAECLRISADFFTSTLSNEPLIGVSP